jgi:hypothetical protein
METADKLRAVFAHSHPSTRFELHRASLIRLNLQHLETKYLAWAEGFTQPPVSRKFT